MKQTALLFLMIILVQGFPGDCFSQKKKITVHVIDNKTRAPIDNAQVTVVTLINSKDVIPETKNTSKKGKCSFQLNFDPTYQYNIDVRKKKFYPYYSTDSNNMESSFKTGIKSNEKEITLYLSSDSLQLLQYYSSLTPHFQIDTLINLLKTNKYKPKNRLCLPELRWEDIPKLLEVGNAQKIITRFPHNPISSYDPQVCFLGVVALWMIESIRISEGKPMISPQERFPSQNPMLISKNQEKETRSLQKQNTEEMLQEAYRAYMFWWKKVQNMDRKKASKIDPLANTGLSW
jgi:5-hydroxyisourate hydrolase-like protein (transthyretin family)